MTREEAINILDDYDVNFDGHTAEEIAEAFDMAFKALEQEPKTGHWIDDISLGYHVSICSNCEWRGHGNEVLIYKPKYCPNCGVKMEGA